MVDVETGISESVDGEDTPPTMGVCEPSGYLKGPVYLIKNESECNKEPARTSPAPCLSFIHNAAVGWDSVGYVLKEGHWTDSSWSPLCNAIKRQQWAVKQCVVWSQD